MDEEALAQRLHSAASQQAHTSSQQRSQMVPSCASHLQHSEQLQQWQRHQPPPGIGRQEYGRGASQSNPAGINNKAPWASRPSATYSSSSQHVKVEQDARDAASSKAPWASRPLTTNVPSSQRPKDELCLEDDGAGALTPRARRAEEARKAAMAPAPMQHMAAASQLVSQPASQQASHLVSQQASQSAWQPHLPPQQHEQQQKLGHHAPRSACEGAMPPPRSFASLVALGAASADGLNEQQRRAANYTPDTPLVIFAPAGAGKTLTLVHRVLFLIGDGGLSMDEVLCLTFTRKASLEVRQRLHALGANEVEVATFHGWCLRLLRTFPQLIGRSPGFRLASPTQQMGMLREAIMAWQAEHGDGGSGGGGVGGGAGRDGGGGTDCGGSNATPRSTAGPSAFTAGTRKKSDALTAFCRKMQKAMRDAKLLGNATSAQTSALLSSDYGQFVAAHYDAQLKRLNLVDLGDLQSLAVALLADPGVLQQVRSRYKHVLVVRRPRAGDSKSSHCPFPRLRRPFHLHSRGEPPLPLLSLASSSPLPLLSLSFSHLLLFVLHVSTPQDEYQDTNLQQLQIIKILCGPKTLPAQPAVKQQQEEPVERPATGRSALPLAQTLAQPPPPPPMPEEGAAVVAAATKDSHRRETLVEAPKLTSRIPPSMRHQPPPPPPPQQPPPPLPPHPAAAQTALVVHREMGVTVVGDDDQSIYSFRGAQPGVFHAFGRHMHGCGTVTLTQNFRSSGHIVSASTAVIRPNKGRVEKQVWTEALAGGLVEVVECRNEACEYDHVVGVLKAHAEANGSLADCAVLYRTHAVGNLVYKALRDHHIPCASSTADVLARTDVAPLLAALRLIANVDDDAAFRYVAASTAPPLSQDLLNGSVRVEATRLDCSLHAAARSLLRGGATGGGAGAGGGAGLQVARGALEEEPGPNEGETAAAAAVSVATTAMAASSHRQQQQQRPQPTLDAASAIAVRDLLRKLSSLRDRARLVPPATLLQDVIQSGLLPAINPRFPPHGAKLLADELTNGCVANEQTDPSRLALRGGHGGGGHGGGGHGGEQAYASSTGMMRPPPSTPREAGRGGRGAAGGAAAGGSYAGETTPRGRETPGSALTGGYGTAYGRGGGVGGHCASPFGGAPPYTPSYGGGCRGSTSSQWSASRAAMGPPMDRIGSLRAFLEQSAMSEYEHAGGRASGGKASGVTLSTIHGAKGREWKLVLIVRVNEDVMPLSSPFDDEEGVGEEALREERRLLYVAMTRARERLVLSHVMVGADRVPCPASRFLLALPAEHTCRSSHFELKHARVGAETGGAHFAQPRLAGAAGGGGGGGGGGETPRAPLPPDERPTGAIASKLAAYQRAERERKEKAAAASAKKAAKAEAKAAKESGAAAAGGGGGRAGAAPAAKAKGSARASAAAAPPPKKKTKRAATAPAADFSSASAADVGGMSAVEAFFLGGDESSGDESLLAAALAPKPGAAKRGTKAPKDKAPPPPQSSRLSPPQQQRKRRAAVIDDDESSDDEQQHKQQHEQQQRQGGGVPAVDADYHARLERMKANKAARHAAKIKVDKGEGRGPRVDEDQDDDFE